MEKNLRADFPIRILLFVLLNPLSAQAEDAKPVTTPASAVQSFYRSYLRLINDSRIPLRSNRDLMHKYVDRSLLLKLDKQTTPDEDYFTKSQDILDNWIDHVTVVDQPCPKATCHLQVILGLPDKTPYKIDVDMSDNDGGWKISKVTKPPNSR